MAKWRHWPVFDEPYAAVTHGPGGKPAEAKFGPPAESSRDWGEAKLKHATRTVLGANMIDEHDLAAGPGHTNEFVERGLRLRHRRDNELGYHHIEGPIRQRHALGIHHCQCLDIA